MLMSGTKQFFLSLIRTIKHQVICNLVIKRKIISYIFVQVSDRTRYGMMMSNNHFDRELLR